MELEKIVRVFPSYFENFEIPSCACEQEFVVYRACKTRKIERESFLNTFEENQFIIPDGREIGDPQLYCMSTFEKLKDVKRFVAIDSNYSPPMLLAKGKTVGLCGVSCRTKLWKKQKKSNSHVDWWLYENSEPWLHFTEVDYEYERLYGNKQT